LREEVKRLRAAGERGVKIEKGVVVIKKGVGETAEGTNEEGEQGISTVQASAAV